MEEYELPNIKFTYIQNCTIEKSIYIKHIETK